MNKIIPFFIIVVILCCGISCSDMGLIAGIESESELADGSLTGYIQHVFSVGDDVYAVNGNMYKRTWNGSWSGWSKMPVPWQFTAIRHAGAIESTKKILALFDEGDSRVFADGGLQSYDCASGTWTPIPLATLSGSPYAIFSSCNSSYVYLLTKDNGTTFNYYLYEWDGNSTFTPVYTSPETDSMQSSSNQSDNYRPRAVTKSNGSAFIVTKKGIYNGNILCRSIESGDSNRKGGIGITSDGAGNIYAVDYSNVFYYSTDNGATWKATSSYSPSSSGESAALQYVPAGTFSAAQSLPLILSASDGGGYYELSLQSDGTPVSSMTQPGTVVGMSSVPHVTNKKSFNQYYSAIGTDTISSIFWVSLDSAPERYCLYVSVVDDIHTGLWGYYADSSVMYTESDYPKWDRE